MGTLLRTLAARAIQAARKDAAGLEPQALYVGNVLASTVSHQANLGALLVDDTALHGIEAFSVEAAEASAAGAFRLGYLAVASGFVDTAMVVGVEKYTDMVGPELESAVAHILDSDYEGMQGLTPTAQAALMMHRYLYETHAPRQAFAGFATVGQHNAVSNLNAYFRKPVDRETYAKAEVVMDPLNLYDIAPYADGAATLLLACSDCIPVNFPHPVVKVTGSSVMVDALALHDRPDPLAFTAAHLSIEEACRQAGILPEDVDFFELWDAYSIYAALSLEAAGFARRGEGWKLAQGEDLALTGKLPISTLGGQKGRGNPLGASGAYQLVEAALQLRGEAGPNQLKAPHRALVQTLGGPAATAVTHILERI